MVGQAFDLIFFSVLGFSDVAGCQLELERGTIMPDPRHKILLNTILSRQPTSKVIVNSDRGSQFSSDAWNRFCRDHNIERCPIAPAEHVRIASMEIL